MVDLILIIFLIVVFYAGFRAGAKYSKIGMLWVAVKTYIATAFK